MAPQIPTSNGSWQVVTSYTGADSVTAPVYLLPPVFTYKASTQVSVNQIYLGGSGFAQYTFANDDFAFAFVPNGAAPPYQRTVAAQVTLVGTGNMWSCGASARTALASNFQSLLAWVEATLELPGVVVAGSTDRIARTVVDALPLAPDEVLAYRYGLSTGLAGGTNAYVDLRTGMRLLLETSTSQFIGPAAAQNGYVSTAGVPISIGSVTGSDGRRTLTCDPFLATINAPVVSGASGTVRVAGGVVDLQAPGLARAHWRLFYPTTVAPPGQPGDTTLLRNVGLMGCDTLAQLAAATAQYPTTVDDGGSGGTPAPTTYTVFLGRALAVPQIPIWVNGNSQTALEYVSLGTTIANVVERYTDLPLTQPGNVVTIKRPYGTGTASISFALTTSLPAVPLAVYDLPLQAGDALTLTV